MNNFFHRRSLRQRGLKPLAVTSLLLGAVCTSALAQDNNNKKEPEKQISDKVSEAIGGPIKNAKDAKNWNEVIRLEDQLLAQVPANSYDHIVLTVDKAQVYIAENQMIKAIGPLEEAIKLNDEYHFFDDQVANEMVLNVAQILGTEAGDVKNAEEQRRLYSQAYTYVRRYLDSSKTPNADMEQFAASVLLNEAMVNPEKVDIGLVKQGQAEVEKGMRLAVHPKEAFYVYLLLAYQEQGEYKKSADVLELLVKLSPNNKQYWGQLAQTYLQLAQGEGETNQNYSVLAILAMERAQQYGALTTPKDNYNLAATYYNIQQFDRAAELLESGLKSGAIENDTKNWSLLALSYQQQHKELKAIEALKEGSRRFPKNGELDLQIANLYVALDRTADAYTYAKLAVEKGLPKPAGSYVLLAYLAYELKKFDEAHDAVQHALKLDPTSKDAVRLNNVINDAIRERDAAKNTAL